MIDDLMLKNTNNSKFIAYKNNENENENHLQLTALQSSLKPIKRNLASSRHSNW